MTTSNIVIFMSDHAMYMCENEKEMVLKAFQLKSTVNLQSADSILTLLTRFLYSLVSFLESVKSRDGTLSTILEALYYENCSCWSRYTQNTVIALQVLSMVINKVQTKSPFMLPNGDSQHRSEHFGAYSIVHT